MDAKQKDLLTDLHARLIAGDFGEVDVYSLLALLLDDAPGGGPVRELGDFVAHRARGKGHVHRYLREMKTVLDQRDTQQKVLRVRAVFSDEEIARALDTALAVHGLAALSQARHRQVQLAVLSMLQGVSIVDNTGTRFGTLELSIMRDVIELLGVVTLSKPPGARGYFRALAVTNDCYPMYSEHGQMRPRSLLKVCVRGGVTVLEGIKPFEIHVGRKRERVGDAPAPITWAEVETTLPDLPVMAVRPDSAELDVPATDRTPVTFRLHNGRLSFPGRTEYIAKDSPVCLCALLLKQRLGAHVYDDTGGYLFETAETLNTLEPE